MPAGGGEVQVFQQRLGKLEGVAAIASLMQQNRAAGQQGEHEEGHQRQQAAGEDGVHEQHPGQGSSRHETTSMG